MQAQSLSSHSYSNQSPLLVIVGETASGKSEVAMTLAEKFNGEIIAADSTTVYKEFDIGTAKPLKSHMEQIPHHMVDIIEPTDNFTAAIYKTQAEAAIKSIKERGKLPIMVGGTGLYIDSVLFDYSFAPTDNKNLRERLESLSTEQLVEELQRLGIELSGVDTKNKRRLMRLIETGGHNPSRKSLRGDAVVIGLQPGKDVLQQNIVRRTEAMLRTGLLEEVKALQERYGWDIAPMQIIGYREFKPYFLGSASLEEVQAQIIKDTLLLAKKQRTWFRRNKSIHWYSDKGKAVDDTTTVLNKLPI